MKRFLLISVTLGMMAFLLTSVASAHLNHQFFIGLWEGVDPLDGSGIQLSISDNDRDGVFDIIGRETFFASCERTGGDGIVQGTGILGDDKTLNAELTVTCRGGDSTGPFPQVVEPVRKDDIIVIAVSTDDANASRIILHRVSSP